jgi:hypothetical protein
MPAPAYAGVTILREYDIYDKSVHGSQFTVNGKRDAHVGMLTTEGHMPTSEDVRGHGTRPRIGTNMFIATEGTEKYRIISRIKTILLTWMNFSM